MHNYEGNTLTYFGKIRIIAYWLIILPIIGHGENILSLNDTTVIAGDTVWVQVHLANEDEAVGFQFDLAFPDECTYSGVSELSDRADGHVLVVNTNGNYLRFMAYNLNLNSFTGTDGNLLRIGFVTQQPYGTYPISLVNPVVGNAQSENILSDYNNGSVVIASPEPQLTSFDQIVIAEDSNFIISEDSLFAHAYDANTALSDLSWSFSATYLTVAESGGNYIVSPDENWHGRDTLTISAFDGQYTGDAIYPVRVMNVNDLPTLLESIPEQSIEEDTPLQLNLAPYFFDADGALIFGVVETNEHISFFLTDSFLTLLPDSNWFGSGVISVLATDGLDTIFTDFSLNVTNVNDPVFGADMFENVSIIEDSTAIVQLESHFSDIDSDLSFSATADSSTITLSVDGNTLLLTPDDHWFGNSLITITANDGEYEAAQSFLFFVSSVNDAPVLLTSFSDQTIIEDSDLTAALQPYFLDVDSDINYSVTSQNDSVQINVTNDTLLLTPNSNWFGETIITIQYQDEDYSFETQFIMEVLSVNDAIVQGQPLPDVLIDEDETASISLFNYFSDIDSEIQYSIFPLQNINSTIQNGSLTLSPDKNWFGEKIISISATDGEYTLTDSIQLIVNAVNDPPEPITLLSPSDNQNINNLDSQLLWEAPWDVDSDSIITTLFLSYNDQTFNYDMVDSSFSFNVVEMQIPYDESIEWWLSVSDGILEMVTTVSHFIVPASVKYAGPVWHVTKLGDAIISDGSERFPYLQIQEGIDASFSQDTILVAPGLYQESISFSGKNVVLSSQAIMTGDTSAIRHTIIDGNNDSRCLTFNNNENINSKVYGFTIQNGYTPSGGGGGIFISNASPKIQYCIIQSNTAYSGGGGIALQYSNTIIENCTIVNNSCLTSSNDGDGGLAIFSPGGYNPVIKNSIIYGNNTAYQYVDRSEQGNFSYSLSSNIYPENMQLDTTNLINTDPLFVDENGSDYSLQFGSPSIDAGDPDNDGDGESWLTDTDDWDWDGTRLDMGALFVEQNDSMPPVVNLVYPSNDESIKTSQEAVIVWDAEDNRVLTWAKLYYSIDGGLNFTFIDSIYAGAFQYSWFPPPEALTTNARIRIFVSDRGENTSFDESSNDFTILDGTPPSVDVLIPNISTFPLENELMNVSWLAADNDELDSVKVYFSVNNGTSFNLMASVTADSTNISFLVPVGITPLARVKLIISDVSGNEGEGLSELFSVSDNTAPTVSITTPDTASIGQEMSLSWDAEDNGYNFQYHLLYLSIHPDSAFTFIDTVFGNHDELSWSPPNLVTDLARIKVTSVDMVQLDASDTSDFFPIIDEVTPLVSIINPGDDFSIDEYANLNISWDATDNQSLDSTWLYFSQDGVEYFFIERIDGNILDYNYEIPFGVSNGALIKLDVTDIYGNIKTEYSEPFAVTDNTAPIVQIETPLETPIGDALSIEWTASDNTTLRSHNVYFSSSPDSAFILIDSTDGDATELIWQAPNIVTDEAQIRIETFDIVNLSMADTSDFFSIVDGINPVVELLNSLEGFSIPEYNEITVSWVASDNIEMDSVRVFYSNDGGNTYEMMGVVSSGNSDFSFNIPAGVGEIAQIKTIAVDTYGNEGEDISDYFSVTDNTLPQVTVNTIPDAGTQDSLYMTWDASDNTGIASNVLYFSSNNGDTYILIDSVSVETNTAQTRAATFPIHSASISNQHIVSGTVLSQVISAVQSRSESRTTYNYTWVAPDLVSDQCRIKVISYDLVSLSTENESEVFSTFDGVDPVVEVTSPLSGYSTMEYEDATVIWNATDNIEMDSIRIFFSNDGGNEFTLVGQASAPINEYVFSIPFGVTDNAQIRLVAVDIYGNEGEDTSDYFSVTDNTHPEVMIEDLEDVHIADEISIQWSASDNTALGYHKIYFSPELSQNFALIDSVGGGNQSTSWTVPNIDTDEARILIETTDIVGLTDLDTTNTFTILDGIPPVLTVTGPSDGYTIPEYHTATVSWDASDNIELDSAVIEYTLSGDIDYTVMGSTMAITGNFDFMIPQGMANEARIRVTIFDIAGNIALDSSSTFTVTDFTPPSIQIESPVIGEKFDIDGTMEMVWLADDNVNVENVDIAYSVNNGTSWQEIQLNNDNDGNYSWMVINDPSDSVQIRTIAFDAIGLSDTSIVGGLSIDIVYPIVSFISPVPGTLNWQKKQIEIQFSQQMMPEGFSSDFINFTSDYSDTVNSIFTYIDSTQSIVLDLSTGFASGDSVTITLDAAGVSNYYGYALDGNADGEGGDSYSFGYRIGMAGDYNLDNVLNGSDLAIFVYSWENDRYVNELGPYSGDVPNIVIHPDQVFNIEDVMSFVVMGNWYLNSGGLLFSNTSVGGSTLSYGIENDSILIDLPLGVVAFDFELNYDLKHVTPGYEKAPGQLTLIHFNKTGGKMNVISEAKLDNRIKIPFTLEEKKSQIQLFINGYDSKGLLIVQLKEIITLNAVPEEFVLSQNYPNPFNPVTQINYGLPEASSVHLAIYDILGREVTTLVNWEQDAGYKSMTWNGTDALGRNVSAGMYFYLLQAGDFRKVNKMILLK